MIDVEKRVFLESLIAIAASIFFWSWALILTIQVEFDTGLICFIPTLASGVGGLLLTKDYRVPRRLLTIGTISAFTFTTIVFISASAHNDEGNMHLAYLIVSAFIWGGFGAIYYFEISGVYKQRELQRETNALLMS